ncbi:hypothetical protein EYF80_062851 [Liparis tanakae]|uniref:Uncharacterized protein n=1 Tax=Liparis tanakae TaxID=230148 RepID=A0A4Z2EDP2_9TELE|nr:hypothetical protein EYF80_062851 [Liparis tanakae]
MDPEAGGGAGAALVRQRGNQQISESQSVEVPERLALIAGRRVSSCGGDDVIAQSATSTPRARGHHPEHDVIAQSTTSSPRARGHHPERDVDAHVYVGGETTTRQKDSRRVNKHKGGGASRSAPSLQHKPALCSSPGEASAHAAQ